MDEEKRERIKKWAYRIFLLLLLVGVLFVVGKYYFFAEGRGYDNFKTESGYSGISEVLADSLGIDEVGLSEDIAWLNYVFGTVPKYMVDSLTGAGALGTLFVIWIFLVFMLSDIISFYTSANVWLRWLSAALAVVVLANLGVVKWVAVTSLALTSGFGTLSIAAAIFLILVFFMGINFLVQKSSIFILGKMDAPDKEEAAKMKKDVESYLEKERQKDVKREGDRIRSEKKKKEEVEKREEDKRKAAEKKESDRKKAEIKNAEDKRKAEIKKAEVRRAQVREKADKKMVAEKKKAEDAKSKAKRKAAEKKEAAAKKAEEKRKKAEDKRKKEKDDEDKEDKKRGKMSGNEKVSKAEEEVERYLKKRQKDFDKVK